MSWETFNEEGFRTLHDVQSFRGVRNPARSQNARFSLAHRLAATFSGAGNGMSAMDHRKTRTAAGPASRAAPPGLTGPPPGEAQASLSHRSRGLAAQSAWRAEGAGRPEPSSRQALWAASPREIGRAHV